LLWPSEEPWPTCPDHPGPWPPGDSVEDILLRRRIYANAWSRPHAAGSDLLTAEENATIAASAGVGPGHGRIGQDGLAPLIPVAQLYASDVPDLPRPEGTDLLQVLWCPFDHEPDYMPRTMLRWRSAADVAGPIAVPPRPSVVGDDEYVPQPCLLHPETVTEYPAPPALPRGLRERILGWQRGQEVVYQYALAVAPGWKVGGHASWSFSDPSPMYCGECGSVVRPLLTLDSCEWAAGSVSWRPIEDMEVGNPRYPGIDGPMTKIGRSYTMQIYICASSYAHPHLQNMQ
jgi:hypothetical protein